MSEIKNIIFDIGNVLVDWKYREHVHTFGFSAETEQRVVEATLGTHAWNEFDRGALTDEEQIDLFVANAPDLEKEIRAVFYNVSGMLHLFDYTIPMIRHLTEQGRKVYYLSNFSRKSERDGYEELRFIPYTNGGILSYQEQLLKPEPAIYELLLRRYGLNPSECLFFDDREDNCMGAERFGIHTHRFIGYEDAMACLKGLGID